MDFRANFPIFWAGWLIEAAVSWDFFCFEPIFAGIRFSQDRYEPAKFHHGSNTVITPFKTHRADFKIKEDQGKIEEDRGRSRKIEGSRGDRGIAKRSRKIEERSRKLRFLLVSHFWAISVKVQIVL